MAGRRTNLGLLVLLAAAIVTGVLAYGIGSGWGRVAVIAHGVAGLGLLLLAPWKSAIARRGLRRRRPGSWASVTLTVLAGMAVAFGVLHATGLVIDMGPVTAMQVHVGAAVLAIPFAVWHVVARRVRPRRTDLSRRALLRAGAVVGGAGLAYAGVEGVVRLAGLRGDERRFTGSYERGSGRPEEMPVTQWFDDAVPSIDAGSWRLDVVGADATIRRWSYEELAGFEDTVRATLDCTGGWYASQVWEGVWLSRLLPGTGDARSLKVVSVTGYPRRFPIEDASGLLLATRVGGRALDAGHGFPARLVAPGRRGFWWVKWVARVEASPVPWWWQWPFPVT